MIAVAGIAAVVAGLGVLAGGLARWWRTRALRSTPVREVLSIDEPGTVALVGTVAVDPENGPETIASPITGRECVVAAWSARELTPRAHRKARAWVGAGYTSTTFFVEDDTGRIRVDVGSDDGSTPRHRGPFGKRVFDRAVAVGDVRIDPDTFEAAVIGAGQTVPDSIQALEADGSVPRQFRADDDPDRVHPGTRDRRYEESIVRPGDEVFLLGTATHADGATAGHLHPNRAAVRPEARGPSLFLSTESRDAVLETARGWTVRVAGGLAATLVGVALVVLL